MHTRPALTINTKKITSAAFVVDEQVLRYNLSILKHVKDATGCKMFQALKTWATYPLFSITKEYLDGTEVSSLNEARLGYDYFNKQVHMFAPAYTESEFSEVLKYTHTVIFNSCSQLEKYVPRIRAYNKKNKKQIEWGLRINPEFTGTDEHGGLWSPCAPGSRLGVRKSELIKALAANSKLLVGLSGFHFHMFFDKNFDELTGAVSVIESNFGEYLHALKWVNFGGGQKITDDGYDVRGLIRLVVRIQKKYNVIVHFEPGAAIVKNAGALVTKVLDIVERDDVAYKIAILDISFNAHTPDFLLSTDLDMPVLGARVMRDLTETRRRNIYQLAGGTCVTGDVLGHFHEFQKPLQVGDMLVLEDGIQYNMVQCTMFNGVQHPSIILTKNNKQKTIRTFTYKDFKNRMG